MTERIRRAREEAGLTLRQLADRAGVAASTIQKVESGKIVPSVAVMVRLADALNRRASYFIESDGQTLTDVRHVPHGAGRRLGEATAAVQFEHIAEPLVNPRMEAFRIRVKPGGRSGGEDPIIYRGEEIVVCTRGSLVFEIREQEHHLHPGDSLHFKGDIPHAWYNPGPGEAEMIMVCAFVYP
jgi:transcriptional regulator with XRE-family HTH domain